MPSKSEIRSRKDPHLDSQLTKKIKIKTPIISANMDTITDFDMAVAMDEVGAVGILHRFSTVEDQATAIRKMRDKGIQTLAASIGVNGDYKERAEALLKAGTNVITLDIAHGHSVSMLDVIMWLKDKSPETQIIAGNVATAEATDELIRAGADAIKVGIGPGSMCTTRIITGCGVPQLTAVAMCAEVGIAHQVPIIADGGIRTSGDMIKAFAAGASSVMIGSMLSGTLETPGPVENGQKAYRGMASKAAQESWRGEVPKGMAAEGESTKVSLKGSAKDMIFELTGGIRSGMSYINAGDFSEIREKARFIEITTAGVIESRPHGLAKN